MNSGASKSRRIQVVYYLSRGGKLEHPHLLELTVSSTQGLYLRDVKDRLTVIRGKGVAASFSWSYKRSYKNGYVWQDICDDDLIFPAHGCEYVLKGSEIFSSPDKLKSPSKFCPSSDGEEKLEFQKSCCIQSDESIQKPKLLEKATEISENDSVGEEANAQTNCSAADSLQEYRIYKAESSPVLVSSGADAATQTEEDARKPYVLTKPLLAQISQPEDKKKPSELEKEEVSPPPLSSTSSSASTTAPASPVSCRKPFLTSEKYGKSQKTFKRSADASLDSGTSSSSLGQSSAARKSSKSHASNHDTELLVAAASSKSKHAASLLQFMSCGGLDTKDEVLPMSLYLKTKSSDHSTTEQVCELLRSGNCRPWYRLGRRAISKIKNCNEVSAGDNLARQEDNKAVCEVSGRLDKAHEAASLPDVISLGRSSGSEQSSCEQNEPQAKDPSTYMEERSRERVIFQTEASHTATVPPLTPRILPKGNSELETELRMRIPPSAASKAEQAGENSNKEVNRGYQSMALVWEELLAPKKDHKDREDMSKTDRQKSLQDVMDQNQPPLGSQQLVQECRHCGRKPKGDSVKLHMKSCSKQNSKSNNGSFNAASSKNAYVFNSGLPSFPLGLK